MLEQNGEKLPFSQFPLLGIDLNISNDTIKLSEIYVYAHCHRSKMKSVDEVRSFTFWSKYSNGKKL